MRKFKLLISALLILFSLGVAAQTTVDCYPLNAANNTGTCSSTAFTQTSLIQTASVDVSKGFAKFDISAIPDGAVISDVTLHIYGYEDNWAYFRIFQLTNDPTVADAATMWTDCSDGNQYYTYTSNFPSPSWGVFDLGTLADADLQAMLASDWFGIGLYEYETSPYYIYFQGWNEANKPYVSVTYTVPGAPNLVVAPTALSFGYTAFGNTSTEQSFTVTGSYLTGFPSDIVVTAPAGFLVSLTSGSGYAASLTIPYATADLATTTVYTVFQPDAANTDYSGNITVVGGGDNKNVAVSGTSNLIYCASGATTAADEEIYSVTINGIINAYDCTTIAPGTGSILNRYSNFTPLGSLANLEPGATIPFIVEENECDGATFYSFGCAIWIDYNQDGDWDDADEQVFVETATAAGPRNVTGSFIVPLTATTGETRMRVTVAESYSGASLTPCLSYGYGETEDYKVNILPVPTCPMPSNLTAANITGHEADLSWTESATAAIWNVEVGLPGFTPGTGTSFASASGLTTMAWTVTGLAPTTTYQFFVQADCTLGDLSNWAGPFSFTTDVTCPQPTGLVSTYYDSDEVTLEWVSGGAAHWNVEYGPVGYTPGNGTLLVDVVSPYTVTGLTAETAYDFYVQDSCGVGDVSLFTGPESVTTTATCPTPIDLNAAGITDISADLSWNGFDATLWDIEIGVSPFTPTGTPSVEDVTNPYTVTGLTGQTTYDYYVRSDCGGTTGAWAGPYTFTTLMTPFTNPTPCGIGVAINDNSCSDIPLNVTGVAGTQLGTDIQLKEVKFIATHTFDGDVHIYLESPTGILVDLTQYNGGSGDNFGVSDGTCTQFTNFQMCATTPVASGTAPFNGNFIPVGDFADFNDNSDPNGIWVLHVCDDAGGDVGAVNFIELVFGNSGNEGDILSYSFPSEIAPATIDNVANTIEVTVGSSTDVTALVATFTLSSCATAEVAAVAQVSGVTANDFTSSVTYTVYAEDGTPETWTVTVIVAPVNTETDILTYSFAEETAPASIDAVAHYIEINVNWMADLTNLVATFTLSYGANATVAATPQVSGVTPNNFIAPLTYTVTAEDGITTQDWVVKVLQDAAPQGALCDNPIPLTLPVIGETGTTDGFGDNYGTSLGGNPCGGSYLEGDDIVYEFTVTSSGTLSGDMTSPDTWIGMMIYDGCPNVVGTNCINVATSSGSAVSFADIAIDPGTYYVIISSWPAPQSIDFTFNLSFVPSPLDLAVVFPEEVNYVCGGSSEEQVMMYIGNTGGSAAPTGDTIYTYYQFDGGAIVEDTLILGADLMPGDSILFVFDQTVDISGAGIYDFSVWFTYDGDVANFNDTLIGTVENYVLTVSIAGGDTVLIDAADLPYNLMTIGGFTSYYWYNSDESVTSTMPVFQAPAFGWYYVEVTDANGCTAIDSIFVDQLVSTNELNNFASMSVYPNPNKGEFTIDVKLTKTENLSVEIRNVQGQVIYRNNAGNVNSFRQKIDLTEFADGVYYLEVRTDSSFFVEKIVTQ